MKPFLPLILTLSLAGCGLPLFAPKPPGNAMPPAEGETRPQARPAVEGASGATTTAPPPALSARTPEQFDTTTVVERKAAAAPPEPAGERRLGETVASLGEPLPENRMPSSILIVGFIAREKP